MNNFAFNLILALTAWGLWVFTSNYDSCRMCGELKSQNRENEKIRCKDQLLKFTKIYKIHKNCAIMSE